MSEKKISRYPFENQGNTKTSEINNGINSSSSMGVGAQKNANIWAPSLNNQFNLGVAHAAPTLSHRLPLISFGEMDSYNDILAEDGEANNSTPKSATYAISNPRRLVIDSDAISAVEVTKFIMITISLMADFQKSKIIDALADFAGLVADMESKIRAMGDEVYNSFVKEIVTASAELVTSIVSAAISGFAFKQVKGLRAESLAEQQKQIEIAEITSEKANLHELQHASSNDAAKIEAARNKIAILETSYCKKYNLNGQHEIPTPEQIKLKVDYLKSRIERYETIYHYVNSFAAVVKPAIAFGTSFTGQAAGKNRQDEMRAANESQQKEIMMRLCLEMASKIAESVGKFITLLEQLLNILSSNSKAISNRLA